MLLRVGGDAPWIAAAWLHVLALAVAGLEAQVVLAALGLTGTTVAFADGILTAVTAEWVGLAERRRSALAAPVSIGEDELNLTASVGVVVTGDCSDTSEALLHDADTAMYEAKHAGRDQVVLFRSTARTVANAKWGLVPTRGSRLGVG